MFSRNKKEKEENPKLPEFGSAPGGIFNTALDFLWKFWRSGRGRDFIGIFLILLSLLSLLALIGLTSGVWISGWAHVIRTWFGWGSIFLITALGGSGLLFMQHDREQFTGKDWRRVIWLEVAAFSLMAFMSIIGGDSIDRAEAGMDGGLIGWGLSQFFITLLSAVPPGLSVALRVLIFLLFAVLGILLGLELVGKTIEKLEAVLSGSQTRHYPILEQEQAVVVAGGAEPERISSAGKRSPKNIVLPPEFRKEFKIEDEPEEMPVSDENRDERLPPMEILLNSKSQKPNERHINQTAGLIEKTLSDFGIPTRVVGFKVGPTITQFALEPGYVEKTGSAEGDEARQKIRVSQISSLKRDLTLALSAERIRIQAPVPGRPYVGIEVPNEKSALVRLRSILESESFHQVNSKLTIALGRDVSGSPVVADLGRMPHVLIAGTTGSGKSVCIAALTACLVMNNSPEDLRLVMIDPKMVELVRFNGLPHLIGKVETELETINAVLRWVVEEMQRRYKLLEDLRSRDIESYNRKVKRRKDYETLPRLVVMVDELADLMMNSAEQTEATIVRLAQMARAVGIHLVIATQRPSTDVVTGLIKANFPARISFAVASGVDSRVILDTAGAETLLGKGDMLFVNPEAGAPIRAQGVLISDAEIEKVISFWQDTWELEEDDLSPWEAMLEGEAVLADRDELVDMAIELIQQTGKASTSMIQRRLKIGYPRAARLMDELEDLGIVGPSQGGGKERDILIDSDDME